MDRNSRQQYQPDYMDRADRVAAQFTAGGSTGASNYISPEENARALERGETSTEQYSRNQSAASFNPNPLAIPGFIAGVVQDGFNFGRSLVSGNNQAPQRNPQQQSSGSSSQELPGVRSRFSTAQSDEALRSNTGFTDQQTRDFLNFEEQARRSRADDNLRREIGYTNLVADRSNAIANANTGRNMAVNSQNTLNNVYQLAGQRLNDSARDTQNSLNNAAATVASLFR